MASPTFFQSPLQSLVCIFAAFLAGTISLLFLAPFLSMLQIPLSYPLLALLLLAFFASAACIIISRSIRCSMSQKELSLTTGIFSKNTVTILISHIEDFSVSRSPLQNLLGLGTLKIDTAGSYGYEAELIDFPNSSISAIIDFISAGNKARPRNPREA